MYRAFLIIVILTFLLLNAFITISNYYTYGVEFVTKPGRFSIKTYFTAVNINTYYGGMIESYAYGDYNISSTRFFKPGILRNTIFYELIPPPEASLYYVDWWPGGAVAKYVSLSVVKNTPYKIVLRTPIPLTTGFNISLNREYIFYYEKPYFDVNYIFNNSDSREVLFDLSREYNRPVSFFIEVASCFNNDYTDDFQIMSVIGRGISISQNINMTTPSIAPGLINLVGLASFMDDYELPQAIIILPLGETVNYTYGALLYTVQVPASTMGSSIARLEIKSFVIKPGASIILSFRVYMGPLTDVFLKELNILALKPELIKRVYYIPEYPLNYKSPPYRVDLDIQLPTLELFPNATLYIYRLLENDSLELVREIELSELFFQRTIQIDRPGLFKFKVDPSYGFTRDGYHIYEETYVNGVLINESVVPIYNNIVINITFKIKPITWITILVIDENYRFAYLVKDYPVTIELRDKAGNVRKIIVREPVIDLYITPGMYEITVKPLEVLSNRLTDIYFNNYYVLHSISANETRFLVLFKGGSRDMIAFRYVSLKTIGVNPQVLLAIIISLLAVACILGFTLIRLIRGRRL